MRLLTSTIVLSTLLASGVVEGQPVEGQTLRIESLEVAHPERTLQSVTVRIRNVTSEPQSGLVWYVLAAPGEPEPWRLYDYASRERTFNLLPGRTATIEIGGPDTPLDGEYGLSVWLHGKKPESGERFHSDMRNHTAPILIAPPFSFDVDYFVSPPRGESARNILVRFSVRNNQAQTANIGIDYRITPTDEDPEPDMGQLARTAEVASGVDYVVTVRHQRPLGVQDLKITGWIYELVDGRLLYRGTDVTLIERND